MKWVLLIPELYLLTAAAVLFTLAMVKPLNPRRVYDFALTLSALGVVVSLAAVRSKGVLFFEAYRVDLFSQIFKVMLALGLFLTLSLCSKLEGIRVSRHPEFYFLLTTCTLGMTLLVSAVELLTIYLALELTSYSLYILVPLRRGDGLQTEAGIKYFLLGAVTSAMTLFGLASLFGVTQTTYLAELAKTLPGVIDNPMAEIGLVLTLCGFFFKLALFPFHVWAPSVYQGAANQVTAFIATATKVAAIAIVMRVAALSGSVYLVHVLVAFAVASMTFGNLVAIFQEDMKRLLAYSAIAHAGYVLIGILNMSQNGYSGAIFYAMAYLVMSFTCFLVLVKVAMEGKNLKISQLAGLHRRSPLLAMALMVSIFSLGGIPPTIGFTGKFLVFKAAMENGHFYLVLIAMVNVTISLYYYALVVKAAYLTESKEEMPRIILSPSMTLLVVTLVATIIVGGFFPRHLYELARAAAQLLM